MSSTKRIKRNLKNSIKSVCKRRAEFVVNPLRDFTRHGKLPLKLCIGTVLSFSSKSLNGEMVDLFGCKPDMPTVSALHQRLGKIKHSAFQEVFSSFTSACKKRKLFNGYNLYAADGSDLRTLLNPDDKDSFFENGDKGSYNLYHLNALYDLNNNIYIDADVQKRLTLFIPTADLPTEIISLRFKPGSKSTAELYLNNGWALSFRIHNASTIVEPSLKFDIQFLGVPANIITINCS